MRRRAAAGAALLVLAATLATAASAGIATGFADGTYRPCSRVLRDQMASFLARVLDLVVDTGHAVPPDERPD